jgi:two-component system sensor histidine kinase HydH
VHSRLIDLYELAGRLGVLTALSFMLATMLWAMHYVTGGRFFLHGVVSALVVLLLFDPVRTKVTTWISQFFFRERYEFETSVQALRREIAHALQLTT